MNFFGNEAITPVFQRRIIFQAIFKIINSGVFKTIENSAFICRCNINVNGE